MQEKIYFNNIELHIQTIEWCVGMFGDTLTNNKDLWTQYARLTGNYNPCDLSKQSPINKMIDCSTGFYDDTISKAFDFFMEYCIAPIIPKIEQEWQKYKIKQLNK